MTKYDSPVAMGHPVPDVSLGDYIKRKLNNDNEQNLSVPEESSDSGDPHPDGGSGKV